jgi:spermidine synthase
MTVEFIEPRHNNSYAQQFRIDELYLDQRTGHQRLLIFQNAAFGRVMTLDGIVQTTEKDEFIYHEMLTHVPVIAHGNAERVLIIGGGDGGMLREVVRHRSIGKIIQVEIDEQVIAMSRQYLPNHAQGAFDDPRWRLVIGDGFNYVRDCEESFDIIIVDSTDPIGPGEALFSAQFYAACRQKLRTGGILVTQNGVPFEQTGEVINTAKHFRELFRDWHFYSAAIPTYVGGIMAFGWATDDTTLRQLPLSLLQQRYAAAKLNTRYYNPQIHQASFALPQYILKAIGK